MEIVRVLPKSMGKLATRRQPIAKFLIGAKVYHELYQDNLRIDGRIPPASLARSPRKWRIVGLAGFIVVLAVAGGFALLDPGTPQTASAESTPPVVTVAPSPPVKNSPVPLANLFGLGVKTVVIDPGHGGQDPGAVGPTNLYEKTVTLDVAQRLKLILASAGLRVRLTRDEDVRISLKDRVEVAVEEKADLFLSLHVNALPEPMSMVETFYFGFGGTSDVIRMAERENVDSGYSQYEWQQMLSTLGKTVKREESIRLAEAIQEEVFSAVKTVNPETRSWGTKPGPFTVLLGVPVPAALAEISVISNPKDESLLRQDPYLDRIAESLGSGILTYLGRQ